MAAIGQHACRITIENLDGQTAFQTSGLRIQFQVKKTLRFEPSTADIQIYNVNKDHRAQMKARYAQVVLEAGYLGGDRAGFGIIFSGQARTIDHKRDKADWISKAQCGDGEFASRYTRLVESYSPGTSVVNVAQRLIKALGTATSETPGNLAQVLGSSQFLNGYNVRGPAAKELQTLLTARGLEWSIQDGKVQVLPAGGATKEQAVLVSPSTGLIGSPEHGTPAPEFQRDASHRLKFKCLIDPGRLLKPGGLAQVQSASATGLFRCMTVTYQGDTHGTDWFCDVEANPTS